MAPCSAARCPTDARVRMSSSAAVTALLIAAALRHGSAGSGRGSREPSARRRSGSMRELPAGPIPAHHRVRTSIFRTVKNALAQASGRGPYPPSSTSMVPAAPRWALPSSRGARRIWVTAPPPGHRWACHARTAQGDAVGTAGSYQRRVTRAAGAAGGQAAPATASSPGSASGGCGNRWNHRSLWPCLLYF